MTAVVWAALPLVAVLGHQPPVRPAPVPSAAEALADEAAYRRAVDLYRARQYAAAFDATKRLSRAQIDSVLSKIEYLRRDRAAQKKVSPIFDWPRTDVMAAGLLHGDLAFTLAGTSEVEQFEESLRFAVRILRIADMPRADSREKPQTWTRDWLRAAAALLLVHGLGIETDAVLEQARPLFPDDGPLLLTRGMLAEFDSASAVSSASYLNGHSGLGLAQDQRQQALKTAAAAFERALRVMPDSDEVRAKLAHVDIALKRDAAAIPLLERAQNSPYPTPAYLATLMLGDLRAREGRASEAEALYRGAIATSGGAQSAYVSLCMLQYSTGRQAEAATTLDTMYAQHRAAPVADPWWSYMLGLPQQPTAVLAALRAEARR